MLGFMFMLLFESDVWFRSVVASSGRAPAASRGAPTASTSIRAPSMGERCLCVGQPSPESEKTRGYIGQESRADSREAKPADYVDFEWREAHLESIVFGPHSMWSKLWTPNEFMEDNEYMSVFWQAEEFIDSLRGTESMSLHLPAPSSSPPPVPSSSPLASSSSSLGVGYGHTRAAAVMVRSIAAHFDLTLGTKTGSERYWRIARALQVPPLVESVRELVLSSPRRAQWVSFLEATFPGTTPSVDLDQPQPTPQPLVGTHYLDRNDEMTYRQLPRTRVLHMQQYLFSLCSEGLPAAKSQEVTAGLASTVVEWLVEGFALDLHTVEGRDEYWRVLISLASDELRPVVSSMVQSVRVPGIWEDEIVSMWSAFFKQMASKRPIRQVLLHQMGLVCDGMMLNYRADIAVKALEAALETDANTWKGFYLVWSVLDGLRVRATREREQKARDPKYEAPAWVARLPHSSAEFTLGVEALGEFWRSVFGEDAPVDAVLEELAKDQLEQTIPVLELDGAFKSMGKIFGPNWSALRSEKGRRQFDGIVNAGLLGMRGSPNSNRTSAIGTESSSDRLDSALSK